MVTLVTPSELKRLSGDMLGREVIARCHLGVAEDGRPFAEGQVGGDDHRGLLIEPADEVEQELPAGLGKGQVAALVENDDVDAGQIIGEPSLPSGASFRLELVDEVDDIEEAAAGAAADAGPGNDDRQMRLACAGALSPRLAPGRNRRPALPVRSTSPAAGPR